MKTRHAVSRARNIVKKNAIGAKKINGRYKYSSANRGTKGVIAAHNTVQSATMPNPAQQIFLMVRLICFSLI